MAKALGFDFGTTNSVLAVAAGEATHSMRFDSLAGTTDAYGLIVHGKVVRGTYALLVGTPAQPLIPGREIAVGDAADHYERIEVPRGGDIAFRVLNQGGAPIAAVQVRAIGQEQRMGRPLDLESDKEGRVRLQHLAPGRYHIHFTKQGFKRAVIPEANKPRKNARVDIEVLPVGRLRQALELL